MDTREIETRFLEIDKAAVVAKLRSLGAEDRGDSLLTEIIFYDPELTWLTQHRFARLRSSGGKTKLTYKQNAPSGKQAVDSMREVEFEVSDMQKAETLLVGIGLVAYRRQEKKRHTFVLGDVTIDIDTWPKVPTYLEIEGPSEDALKDAAQKLGFDWSNAVFADAREVLEKIYHLPFGTMRSFTFDKIE